MRGRISTIDEQSYKKQINAKKLKTVFADFVVKNSCFCKVPEEPEKDVKVISFSTEFRLKYMLCSYVEKRRRVTKYKDGPHPNYEADKPVGNTK